VAKDKKTRLTEKQPTFVRPGSLVQFTLNHAIELLKTEEDRNLLSEKRLTRCLKRVDFCTK
jgi:hypothetical protein